MSNFRYLLTVFLVVLPCAAVATDVQEKPLGEAVERHLSLDEPFQQWVQDPDRVGAELSDTIELREGLADDLPGEDATLAALARHTQCIAHLPQ